MFNHPQLKNHRTIVGMDCIFSSHCYQQWLRIKNCLSKHKYFVNIKSDLISIFLVKQHNTQKWPKNSYIFLILEPTGRFVHCKKCSPSNMANKMSLNSYLDHHLCLIFQIWLHNNASWQKGHLIVHLAFKVPVCQLVIVRRAGLLWSQRDFEWRWSVPLFKCLTVLEFSFILFDLCLLITFFNFIMNYVPIVTFWIFTYHKIWILSIMFCFIWSYWIIYFLACLEVSWRVVS